MLGGPGGSPGPPHFSGRASGAVGALCPKSSRADMGLCWGQGATQAQPPTSPRPGGPKCVSWPGSLPPAPASLSFMPLPENTPGAHKSWEGPGHLKAFPHPTPGLPRSARLQQTYGLASAYQKLPLPPGRAGPCTVKGEASPGGMLFPVPTSRWARTWAPARCKAPKVSLDTKWESLSVCGQVSRPRRGSAGGEARVPRQVRLPPCRCPGCCPAPGAEPT